MSSPFMTEKSLSCNVLKSRHPRGPGGSPKLTYAKGWKIINLANEVFGFNGWSSSIVSIVTDFVDYSEESKRFNVRVTAIVRVTLRDGAYHKDVGYGALENRKSKGPALDKVSWQFHLLVGIERAACRRIPPFFFIARKRRSRMRSNGLFGILEFYLGIVCTTSRMRKKSSRSRFLRCMFHLPPFLSCTHPDIACRPNLTRTSCTVGPSLRNANWTHQRRHPMARQRSPRHHRLDARSLASK